MATKHKYETRLNGRGGWEIGILGDRAGDGEGNYPTESDAFAIARRNYEPAEIKRGEEPAARPRKHTLPPGQAYTLEPLRAGPDSLKAGAFVRRVKALTR